MAITEEFHWFCVNSAREVADTLGMDTIRVVSGAPVTAHTILVVDDDVQVLKFLSRMLSSLGYRHVFQASSPEQAFEIWRTHQSQISLVISDFVMPVQTGDRMALDMQRQKPGLKILLISGNDPVTLDSAIPLQSGVNFLQKPFTVTEMRKSVENLSLSA
jgi:DNA-binding NtrC family response regulator